MRRASDWMLGLLLAGTALAAGFVADNGESGFALYGALSSGYLTEVPKCNDIEGTLGLITEWNHSNPTGKQIKSENGLIGVRYDFTADEACDPLEQAVTEQNMLEHQFKRDTGAATNVTIALAASAQATGKAKQLYNWDPSWWWTPTIQIDDTLPTVTVRRADASSGDVPWGEEPTNGYEEVAVQGTGGEQSPDDEEELTAGAAAVLGGNTSGQFDADTGAIPGTGSSGPNRVTSIVVTYVINSSTNRAADNCSIYPPWQVVIQSTMTTTVSP